MSGDVGSQWLCVVGGSASHVPFVQRAEEQGIATIVIDRNADAPARRYATRFEAISTHDGELAVSLLESLGAKINLRGCFTYSSFEPALATAALIVDRFKLKGSSSSVQQLVSDKLAWRKRLEATGVQVPAWVASSVPAEVMAFSSEHGDVIVKPGRGTAGSSGVALLRDGIDVQALISNAKQASTDGSVLVESFCYGLEFSVDGCVSGGNCQVLALSRKHTKRYGSGVLPDGFVIDYHHPSVASLRDRVQELLEAVVYALRLDDTFVSLDVLVSGSALVVIDVGLLLDAKIDRLLHFVGVDVYGLAVSLAMGQVDAFEGPSTPISETCGLRFLYSSVAGQIHGIDEDRCFSANTDGQASGIRIEAEQAVGDAVRPPRSLADVVAVAYATGVSAELVWRDLLDVELDEYVTIEA